MSKIHTLSDFDLIHYVILLLFSWIQWNTVFYLSRKFHALEFLKTSEIRKRLASSRGFVCSLSIFRLRNQLGCYKSSSKTSHFRWHKLGCYKSSFETSRFRWRKLGCYKSSYETSHLRWRKLGCYKSSSKTTRQRWRKLGCNRSRAWFNTIHTDWLRLSRGW